MSKTRKTIRALLIANPGSGTLNGKSALFEQVAQNLKNSRIKLDIAVVKPNSEAMAIAKRAVKDGYKLIIAMGGDDTIESVIRGMGKSKVLLGIIPAGTQNNLAKGLGISEDPEEACALIASGQSRKLDLGQATVGRGKKFLFVDVLTMGFAAALYSSSIKAVKGKGLIASVMTGVLAFLTHPSTPKVTLVMDDRSNIAIETMLVLVANFPVTGANMIVSPDAATDDGLLDVSLFPNVSKAELLSFAVTSLNGGNVQNDKIQRYRASKLKIKSDPRLEVMADGIMLGKGTVRIRILAGALHVIAPPVGAGMEKPQAAGAADLPPPFAPAGAPVPVAVAQKGKLTKDRKSA